MSSIRQKLHLYYQSILRIPRTRGFGVQSPFAYRFLRDVIAPGTNGPCILWLCSDRSRRKKELLSRLDLYCQKRTLVSLKLSEVDLSYLENCLEHIEPSSVLFVDDIQNTGKSLNLWMRLVEDSRNRVVFDLYDCGILFFDQSHFKRVYRVNY